MKECAVRETKKSLGLTIVDARGKSFKLKFNSKDEKHSWITAFKTVSNGINNDEVASRAERTQGTKLIHSMIEDSTKKIAKIVSNETNMPKALLQEVTML